MVIKINNFKAIDCGIGVNAPSSANLDISNFEAMGCNMATNIYIDNDDLKVLLSQILTLNLNSDEEALRKETIQVIEGQIKYPSPINQFGTSLRNIVEGMTGSMLYSAVSVWAASHGISMF